MSAITKGGAQSAIADKSNQAIGRGDLTDRQWEKLGSALRKRGSGMINLVQE